MPAAYFTIPKPLFKNAQYSSISIEAKTLYGYMRDRLGLSIINGWKDERGTFILMARKSIAEFLKRSLPTVRKIIRELIGAGLIRERRMGLTKCNRIYVQPLEGEGENLLLSKEQTGCPSKEKPGFIPEGKPFSPSNPVPKNLILDTPSGEGNGAQKREKYEKRTDCSANTRLTAPHANPSLSTLWPKGTVPAQQYAQREYTRGFLESLFDVI